MVILPLLSNCSLVTTVTGAGVVRSLRRMRDPVTITSSVRLRRSEGGALVGTAGSAAAGWSGVVVGWVCEGVVGVCAAAIPADKRRTEATWSVVRQKLMLVSPRSVSTAAPLLDGGRLPSAPCTFQSRPPCGGQSGRATLPRDDRTELQGSGQAAREGRPAALRLGSTPPLRRGRPRYLRALFHRRASHPQTTGRPIALRRAMHRAARRSRR